MGCSVVFQECGHLAALFLLKAIFYLSGMLPSFFIGENDEHQKGAVYIISTVDPWPVAQVYRFASANDLQQWEKKQERPVYILPGYNVAVAQWEFMAEPAKDDIWDRHRTIQNLADMAAFFARTRIHRDKGYWKKYQEKKPD